MKLIIRWARWFGLARAVCIVLLFALVFVWYGVKFVQFGWNQTSELADLPMAWIFVAWPLTGITWLLFGFERLRADWYVFRHGHVAGDAPPAPRDIGSGSVV